MWKPLSIRTLASRYGTLVVRTRLGRCGGIISRIRRLVYYHSLQKNLGIYIEFAIMFDLFFANWVDITLILLDFT
jgi:hypothetical protein